MPAETNKGVTPKLMPWGHYLNCLGDFCVVVCDGPDEHGYYAVWHSSYGSGSRARPHHADGRVIMQTNALDVHLDTLAGKSLSPDTRNIWAEARRTQDVIKNHTLETIYD